MTNTLKATLFAALAAATLVSAPMGAMADTAEADASYEVSQTRGMDNRDDRQDRRQDCRATEGAGVDKRDCKQDSRQG